MKVEFKSSFVKDFKRVKNENTKNQVMETIDLVERAASLQEIRNIKKLKGGERYYRLRLGDYRLGFVLNKDTLIFVRFLHRKELYRYFP